MAGNQYNTNLLRIKKNKCGSIFKQNKNNKLEVVNLSLNGGNKRKKDK